MICYRELSRKHNDIFSPLSSANKEETIVLECTYEDRKKILDISPNELFSRAVDVSPLCFVLFIDNYKAPKSKNSKGKNKEDLALYKLLRDPTVKIRITIGYEDVFWFNKLTIDKDSETSIKFAKYYAITLYLFDYLSKQKLE